MLRKPSSVCHNGCASMHLQRTRTGRVGTKPALQDVWVPWETPAAGYTPLRLHTIKHNCLVSFSHESKDHGKKQTSPPKQRRVHCRQQDPNKEGLEMRLSAHLRVQEGLRETLSVHCGGQQMSEDPGPGTTTGKDGERLDFTSHGFSLHHFTLKSPALSSPPNPPASGSHCSFCDYRTFTRVSPRHTPHVSLPSVATLPKARCSLKLELENYCDTSNNQFSVLFCPSYRHGGHTLILSLSCDNHLLHRAEAAGWLWDFSTVCSPRPPPPWDGSRSVWVCWGIISRASGEMMPQHEMT
ncbi:unnamed protein product [Pleuronectes platessa]|uniref:Uncharacterized protein n=1 Tax=Pleuronectes platessa TaxID=8262 RepID=A0A9N7TTR0_PLEPL|nr:unnamed protein product [Pleuronectes platessa]